MSKNERSERSSERASERAAANLAACAAEPTRGALLLPMAACLPPAWKQPRCVSVLVCASGGERVRVFWARQAAPLIKCSFPPLGSLVSTRDYVRNTWSAPSGCLWLIAFSISILARQSNNFMSIFYSIKLVREQENWLTLSSSSKHLSLDLFLCLCECARLCLYACVYNGHCPYLSLLFHNNNNNLLLTLQIIHHITSSSTRTQKITYSTS